MHFFSSSFYFFLWVFLEAWNQMMLFLTANSLHILSSLQVVSLPFLFPFSCQHDSLVTNLRGKITFKVFHPPCCSVEIKLTYTLTVCVRSSLYQSHKVWLCEIRHLLQARQGTLIRTLISVSSVSLQAGWEQANRLDWFMQAVQRHLRFLLLKEHSP